MSEVAMKEHWERLVAERGVDVLYRRNGVPDVTIKMVPAQALAQGQQQDGAFATTTELDLIVAVADFELDGNRDKPKHRDKVEYTVNGETVNATVSNSFDEHVWRYSDSYRVIMRIHLDEVA